MIAELLVVIWMLQKQIEEMEKESLVDLEIVEYLINYLS